MFFDMKVLLVVVAFGILLNVAQSKANAVLSLDLSLFTENANAVKGSDKPCCHPETLEGSLTVLSTTESNIEGKFYLDAINQRYAAEDVLSTIKVILVCDSQGTCLIYNIIESEKYCSKYKLTNASIDDFWLRCIPNNATSQGTVRIGSDETQSSLLLQNWMFTYHGTMVQRLVTDVECIPVVEFMSSSHSSYTQQNYYFDITKTIKDPSVFTPPSYCDKANDMHEGSGFQQRKGTNLFSTLK